MLINVTIDIELSILSLLGTYKILSSLCCILMYQKDTIPYNFSRIFHLMNSSPPFCKSG